MIDLGLGRAYNFRRYNCWDHVKKVRDDAGVKTKKYAAVNLKTAFNTITAEMQNLGHGLSKSDTPQDLDIVLGSIKDKDGKTSYHCGVFFDGLVSHCDRKIKSVASCTLKEFEAGFDGVTFWR